FANIVANCRALGESGILSPKFTRLYQSYAQELQAEINEEVMAIMDEVELRDPNDVFIHAEERRRELARQGKKPPPFISGKTLRTQPGTARKTKPSSS